ncbi:MAG: tryptophan synthase subunit alpha [Phycisphaerales bacterium]|nr:tryptophan synthase subunit alpha [Phycisphaerales bacterium]
MSRIDDALATTRAEGRAALIPYITAGYPSIAATESVLAALPDAGADIIEVGIPYSDPIADGPVIAGAMHQALEQGVTVDAAMSVIERVRSHSDVPMVAMVSQSIVHRRGGTTFLQNLADVGTDGVVIPDADLNALDSMADTLEALDLACALLIAPTTPPARMVELAQRCRGFVYLLARTGLTGTRSELPDLSERVESLRACTTLPIAAGFGISTAEQVRQATESCDAAIVGSALVNFMGESDDPVAAAVTMVESLATGIHRS